MLGYVKPDKSELKIKEYEIYRGFYCSLCKALGKNYGQISRLFLSYDATFFTLFLYAIKPDINVSFKSGKCPFNPFKKCSFADIKTDEFRFMTAFSVILTYYKIKDNIHDSSLFKKLKYILLLPFVFFKHKKAVKLYPDIEAVIKQSTEEQNKLENERCDICDKAADPSAKALAKCFSAFADKENETLFYRFGYCLGRYVYLIDAFDDLEKDKKNRSYNVFLLNGYTDKQIAESIRMSINELILCLDLFDLYSNKEILENIIKSGLDNRLSAVIKKKEGTVDEKPV
ncbi:MAG: hypothetical protein J5877_04425 [Clostridia bacterium]|nr:hypothetical protein [Clostridia bacterium]